MNKTWYLSKMKKNDAVIKRNGNYLFHHNKEYLESDNPNVYVWLKMEGNIVVGNYCTTSMYDNWLLVDINLGDKVIDDIFKDKK